MRETWFEYVLHNKPWYVNALNQGKLFQSDCVASNNFFSLLYGIYMKGIDENGVILLDEDGDPVVEASNHGTLSLLIGNERFSREDNGMGMRPKEFCQKVASSTLAKFLERGSDFLETWALHLLTPGKNSDLRKKSKIILTDDQKRLMYIGAKTYMRRKFANPQKSRNKNKGKKGNKENKGKSRKRPDQQEPRDVG